MPSLQAAHSLLARGEAARPLPANDQNTGRKDEADLEADLKTMKSLGGRFTTSY